MFFSVFLSGTMAFVSAYNMHPDEKHHIEAAKYYEAYWLPPMVGDPRVQDSYSIYGVSYLYELEIVYFLAGKFSMLISPLVDNSVLRIRLFNVLLFSLLAFLFALKTQDRWVFLLLLASPQIWYIFGYFNGDAFPLFISILIAYQITRSESWFNQFIKSPKVFDYIRGGVLMGVCLGMLALSKMNYHFFVFFILCWFAASLYGFRVAFSCFFIGMFPIFNKLWIVHFSSMKYYGVLLFIIFLGVLWCARDFKGARGNFNQLVKFAVVIAVAASLFAPRYIYDMVKTGNQITLRDVQEQFALPQYKPSASLSDSFFGLNLKERGINYLDLFSDPFNWHIRVSHSAAGVYGWFTIWGNPLYYKVIILLFMGFLGYIFGHLAILGGRREFPFLVFFGTFILALFFIVSYRSWTVDFQGQGRHIFPMIGMLAIFLGLNREKLSEWVLSLFIYILYGLSVYSFVFTGLRLIPKS